MPLRVLAIEDDPLHAAAIKVVLEQLQHILIDVVDSATDFRRQVAATIPDLLLIDINLGEDVDGIQLAEEVSHQHQIPFIFLTSQEDKESIERATEIQPEAYLIKPINIAALSAAINIATSKPAEPKPSTGSSSVLLLKEEEGLKPLDSNHIDYIEAQNKSCLLVLAGRTKETTMTLSALAKILPSGQFLRVHRSFIVRIDRVELVDPGYQSLTINGTKIPVGRKYKEQLMQRLLKI